MISPRHKVLKFKEDNYVQICLSGYASAHTVQPKCLKSTGLRSYLRPKVKRFQAQFVLLSLACILFCSKSETVVTLHMLGYMVCVFSRFNPHCDLLILGHYSPVMPTGRLRPCKTKAKSLRINNLLPSKIRPSRENLKLWPCCIDLQV